MIDRDLPIDSIFLNSCYNSFCLLSAVKYLRHRRRQLLPLYSLYDSDARTGICCNHLMWVVVVIELFILLHLLCSKLNVLFSFEKRKILWALILFKTSTVRLYRWVSTYESVIDSFSTSGIRWIRQPLRHVVILFIRFSLGV